MSVVAEVQPGEIEAPPLPALEPSTWESRLTVTIAEGSPMTLWTAAHTVPNLEGKLALQLQPEQTVVIGRQEGGEIEYLDPRYQPTQLVPNSRRPVVTSYYGQNDRSVSRGHFMLKGARLGIVLVNGVPRRGGGIRPPLNWTRLLAPEHRLLVPGEEYRIERGNSARIELPNGTLLLLQSE